MINVVGLDICLNEFLRMGNVFSWGDRVKIVGSALKNHLKRILSRFLDREMKYFRVYIVTYNKICDFSVFE